TGTVELGAFYARRVRRLWPAQALVAVTTAVAAAVLVSPLGDGQHVTGTAIAASGLLLSNAYFLSASGGYFQQFAASNPFLHTWTLSVEEQFYLVFPVLLGLGWRVAARRTRG